MDSPAQRNDTGATRGGNLQGIRVLDLSRLAPGPYCSMLLADMGAEVVVVGGGAGSFPIASLARGKSFIGLDLKADAGRTAFHRLAETADVVIEGYRPGVTRRLGIDYETIKAINPRIVYCSVTGYGQSGPLSQRAGHDINYVAMSGAMGAFGPADDVPAFPLNILADFAGGSLFATIGIVTALYGRERTGEGQYIDAAMVDGCLSMMTMHFADWGKPVLPARGDGLIAGNAPYYRCYRCADGRFVAVGALERKFFELLWQELSFSDPLPDHMDRGGWPDLTARFEAAFVSRTRDEWTERFADLDACVTPVLDPNEARRHPQNTGRHPELETQAVALAPQMERQANPSATELADVTDSILAGLGLNEATIAEAKSPTTGTQGLAWPPF